MRATATEVYDCLNHRLNACGISSLEATTLSRGGIHITSLMANRNANLQEIFKRYECYPEYWTTINADIHSRLLVGEPFNSAAIFGNPSASDAFYLDQKRGYLD